MADTSATKPSAPPTPPSASTPATSPPAPTTPAKPKVALPLPFVITTIGTVIFVLGSLLSVYDLQGVGSNPSLLDTLSGKVAVCIALVGLLLVTIKKFGLLASVLFATVFGAVFGVILNVIGGDDGVINLVNGALIPQGGEQASASIGLYVAFVGSAIALIGAMFGAGLIKKSKASAKK